MDYFKILNLDREPFSNSPEPDFFFPSTEHLACLQQLELAIRLRRGLNVVMGEVGTGKTTLCRQLIRRLMESEDDSREIETHLLLDPSFSTPREFLDTVAGSFGIPGYENAESEWQLKEGIKNYLFQNGVDEKKTVVLIIDEGQKLPDFCLEILREFLNYETNENKLLQIVIFAQNEFRKILKDHKNFTDRVNQYYLLGPLNFLGTRAMIRFRLARAGRPADGPKLFTLPALWKIHRATGGYPRRIIALCHQIILALIIQNRVRADWMLVRSTARRLVPELIRRERLIPAVLAVLLFLAVIALVSFSHEFLPLIGHQDRVSQTTANPIKETPAIKQPVPASSAGTEVPPPEKMEGSRMAVLPAILDKSKSLDPPPKKVAHVRALNQQKNSSELGRLKIRKGGTVLRLLQEIYGRTGTARFQALIRANPHIQDMNRVRAGETIYFPAIPVSSSFFAPEKSWVQITKKTELEEAYRFYKDYPAGMPSIRIIPYRNSREGTVFTIVMKYGFSSAQEARNAVQRLPATLASVAEILPAAEKDTIFFAN
jgi:general secretion pathway protein A